MCNSTYHVVAQWLVEILEPVNREVNKYDFRDTFEFVDSISHLNVLNKKMISLGVSSIVMNVPLVETIQFLCDYIESHRINVGLPATELKELVMFCTSNIQIHVNGEFYRQIDGVAIGSPVGSLLAAIFMRKLDSNQLNETIRTTSYYRRYVDHVFCVVDTTEDLQKLLTVFNKTHKNVVFSLERETDDYACDVCKKTVETVKDGLKTGILQQVLEIYLTKECESLGVFAEVCKSAVRKGIKFLSDQVQKMDPEETCKHRRPIMKKCSTAKEAAYLALLEHRNTPSADIDLSPAQRLMGRRTRTRIPLVEDRLALQTVTWSTVRKRLKQRIER
ncbi:uncharacterized protein DEA37_0002468 [Paragonimus westermani]|uniref:Saposin B-type domain-containing protein n=1 Tax=Paragonimus westermani TaxID=34504 RepID=A0A5J4NPY7_9TREM|nr:uncharacterized protein DEA37_0002468 [Paragonimus westermani]